MRSPLASVRPYPWAEPIHILAAVTVAGVLVFVSAVPVGDPDAWWHRSVGEEILATGSVAGLGNAWAPFGDQDWTTTQWLSEVLLALLVRSGGWDLVTLARLAAVAGIATLLAAVLLPGRRARAGVPVFVVVLVGITPYIGVDRPQTLAVAFAVVLSLWLQRVLAGSPLPSLWLLVPFTVLWANLHGTWVLVPGVFALAAVGAAIARSGTSRLRGLAIRTGATLAAGFVTPAAAAGVLAIPRFMARTSNIIEWQPTTPASGVSLTLGLLLLGLLWAWARTGHSVPLDEVVVGIGLVTFGLLAVRNVPFAAVLLAPIVADRLSSLSGKHYVPRPAEQRVLAYVTIGVLALGVGSAIGVHAAADALSDAEPRRIAEALGREPRPVRVLNAYDAAGVLVEFSGEQVELGIDGRADRYPPEYTNAYLDAQHSLIDWEEVVAEVDPDVAVLRSDVALAAHLVAMGWTREMTDGDYILLGPPNHTDE